jgi:type III secretion protein J
MKSRAVSNWMRTLPFAFALLFLTGCGKVELLSNLPENEANEIVAVMQQAHIPVAKKPGVELTWSVVLSNSNDFSKAIKILNSKGYPNTQYNNIGQVFQKSGLVSSPLEERARFMYALSENIAETLNKIPGVLTSRVHIVLPENDPYSDTDTAASSAIFLTYKAGSGLDESVREIKYLVANSVQGLEYDRVSVALFPVAFEVDSTAGMIVDDNVSVMGLKMASDAATKFLVIVVGLSVLALCFAGASAFLFLEWRRAKKGAAVAQQRRQAPVAVQDDSGGIDDLDEAQPDDEK